ncbi:unnamed protein product [Vitrella brassicaformis CCMP3155]|uniref:Uncharacterized protein n=1 Tax=Vitrella brassicaformis (strain CCMP3155) TaxID=1169540 RepID=A0A0G4FDP1_VITBC|nr:unnamed protein product [Vitrella brassicaformis CCMP3155]|eukprot:CEM10993.1 unnamed protein product [Vitrella brassicaformis CCMP3155]
MPVEGVGPVPHEEDLCLTELNEDDIQATCTPNFGVGYLSEAAPASKKLDSKAGKVVGPYLRLMLPLVCRKSPPLNAADGTSLEPGKSLNVVFVVST